jgi:hypothetical protein
MGSSYSRHGGEEECRWNFGEKARDHKEQLGIGGRIILKWILKRHRTGLI